jgi:hypothetical protein
MVSFNLNVVVQFQTLMWDRSHYQIIKCNIMQGVVEISNSVQIIISSLDATIRHELATQVDRRLAFTCDDVLSHFLKNIHECVDSFFKFASG